jgi:hypothetical protein
MHILLPICGKFTRAQIADFFDKISMELLLEANNLKKKAFY